MGEGYHTVNDTIDLLEGEYSFEHLQRFVKLVSVILLGSLIVEPFPVTTRYRVLLQACDASLDDQKRCIFGNCTDNTSSRV